MTAGDGDDTLDGGANNDSLSGRNGDDILIGGSGTDILAGGNGNDRYVAVEAGEIVNELTTSGIDTVETALTAYTMPVNIEIFDYTGTAAVNVFGNTSDNVVYVSSSTVNDTVSGGGGADTINGLAGNDTIRGDGGTDILDGHIGNDVLRGGAGIDTLNGGNGFDSLRGDSENDTLIGWSEDDTLSGGTGSDILDGGWGDDTVDGGDDIDTLKNDMEVFAVDIDLERTVDQLITVSGVDQLTNIENVTGTIKADTIAGDAGANVLDGGKSDDRLYGRGGADMLNGGNHNDTLAPGADNANDTVNGGSGIDTVDYSTCASSVISTYNTLYSGTAGGTDVGNDTLSLVENILGGSADDSFTGWREAHGNGGNDTFRANNGTNSYYGDEGIDTVLYGTAAGTADLVVDLENPGDNQNTAAGDTLVSIENIIYEGTSIAYLLGDGTANYLQSAGQLNTLYGRGGNDTLAPLAAMDIVDAGEGVDTIDYSLSPDAVTIGTFNSILIGSAGAADGDTLANVEMIRGSAFDDAITVGDSGFTLDGGDGADTLTAGLGADTLIGGAGGDALNGGGGSDTATYSDSLLGVTVDLAAGTGSNGDAQGDTFIEIERVIGSNFADTLIGNAANNILIGGIDADTLQGMEGNDTYYVDNLLDVVVEAAGQGVDNINASVSYVLGATVDAETLRTIDPTATTTISLVGNGINNILTGNAGTNGLSGAGGADTIDGLEGNDGLTGGTGVDTFVFSRALNATTNVDQIADFTVVDDTIRLDDAIFTGLTVGTLAVNALRIGAAAADADDRIIYDNTTGALSFDVDGNGAGAAIQFATLSVGLRADEQRLRGGLNAGGRQWLFRSPSSAHGVLRLRQNLRCERRELLEQLVDRLGRDRIDIEPGLGGFRQERD